MQKRNFISLFLLAIACSPAWGHAEAGQVSGFISGVWHPVSGLDHVLAMVAVGLWGAQLGNPALWLLPVAFPLVMAFGGFLGLVGVPLPGTEIGIALSGVLLGLAVATRLQPPLWIATLLVAVFAVFHVTPMAPNYRKAQADWPTAPDLSWPPVCCTPAELRWVCCNAGHGANLSCAVWVASSDSVASISSSVR